jgi:CheY-like chemotaxis protein
VLKILVVEDEALIRLGIVDLLEEEGFEAFEAANSDQAIGVLERNPDIRLIVTDVDMPGSMDGLKLAHFVRQKWPPIQLIIISGKVGVAPEMLPSSARFFSKPYQDDRLIGTINELIGGARE